MKRKDLLKEVKNHLFEGNEDNPIIKVLVKDVAFANSYNVCTIEDNLLKLKKIKYIIQYAAKSKLFETVLFVVYDNNDIFINTYYHTDKNLLIINVPDWWDIGENKNELTYELNEKINNKLVEELEKVILEGESMLDYLNDELIGYTGRHYSNDKLVKEIETDIRKNLSDYILIERELKHKIISVNIDGKEVIFILFLIEPQYILLFSNNNIILIESSKLFIIDDTFKYKCENPTFPEEINHDILIKAHYGLLNEELRIKPSELMALSKYCRKIEQEEIEFNREV